MKTLMLIAVLALSVNAHAEKWEYMIISQRAYYNEDGKSTIDSGFSVEGNFKGRHIRISWTWGDMGRENPSTIKEISAKFQKNIGEVPDSTRMLNYLGSLGYELVTETTSRTSTNKFKGRRHTLKRKMHTE